MTLFLQIAMLVFEIIKLILNRPQSTQVALNESVFVMARRARRSGDLTELRAFRDRLKGL